MNDHSKKSSTRLWPVLATGESGPRSGSHHQSPACKITRMNQAVLKKPKKWPAKESSSSDQSKSFFHVWCEKQNVTHNYDISVSGPPHRPNFVCEVRVKGYNYVGVGTSANKKGAQTNAARDFLRHLIQSGALKKNALPRGLVLDQHGDNEVKANPPGNSSEQATNLKTVDGMQCLDQGEALAADASLHGNWTLHNAKSHLNQFLQANRISPQYRYKLASKAGSRNVRHFFCDMSFFVKQLERKIGARGIGPSKQIASQCCALSLIRQLYHAKVKEAYKGKDAEAVTNQVAFCKVSLHPELEAELSEVLTDLGVVPIEIPQDLDPTVPFNIKSPRQPLPEEKPVCQQHSEGVVPWSPLQRNWNPWAGCDTNTDGDPLSQMTLPQISHYLKLGYEAQVTEERTKLPVWKSKDGILRSIENNSVTIITGPKGCGKTTQVPQYILDSFISRGSGADCCVIVTQPENIGVMVKSEQVAEQRLESLGNSVGYRGQFASALPRPYGAILFCTVDVLLRKMEAGLKGVSHIIVDEIHTQDINLDILLIVLKDMVKAFPQFRIILMSSVTNVSLYQQYFNNCPVITVAASTFLVQEFYMEDCMQIVNIFPPSNIEEEGRGANANSICEDPDEMDKVDRPEYSKNTKTDIIQNSEEVSLFGVVESVLMYINDLGKPGAVIIFLPELTIMFALNQHLEKIPLLKASSYCILPLYSQLPWEDQRKVLEPVPSNVTKLILAVDITETSVFRDITYVIDMCKYRAKLKLSNFCTRRANYSTMWSSRVTLEQRKACAGHVRPGFCFRLCTRAQYNRLENNGVPEMLCTPLHEICLKIKFLKLGDSDKFFSKALDSPPLQRIINTEVYLQDIGALGQLGELTPLGRILAHLPVEPRVGKMIILSCLLSSADAICTVAAISNTYPEVFTGTSSICEEEDGIHQFSSIQWSDHIAMLKVTRLWEEACLEGSTAELLLCKKFSICQPTMGIISNAKKHLKSLLREAGFPDKTMIQEHYVFNDSGPKLDTVAALLVMGFYPNIYYHKEQRNGLTEEGTMTLTNKAFNSAPLPETFPFPFFIFENKTHKKVCEQVTMVTPIQLLLFGCDTVEVVEGIIRIDKWISLKMCPRLAAKIVAMQPVIESLITKAINNPKGLTNPSATDRKFIEVLKKLCNFKTAKCGLTNRTDDDSGPPIAKVPRLSTGSNKGRRTKR